MTDLSSGQVAKLLGVRRETVWRWIPIMSGDGRYYLDPLGSARVYRTTGGHLRFTPETVKWLRKEHGTSRRARRGTACIHDAGGTVG
jgi:hypothetical protein